LIRQLYLNRYPFRRSGEYYFFAKKCFERRLCCSSATVQYCTIIFVSYFASQSKGIKFDAYVFDVLCKLQLSG